MTQQPIVIIEQAWIPPFGTGSYFKVIVPQEDKQFMCVNLESARKIADDYADFYNSSVKVKEVKHQG